MSAVVFIFDFTILMENVHVYNCPHVLHVVLTHFNFISVEYLVKGVFLWEMGI